MIDNNEKKKKIWEELREISKGKEIRVPSLTM